ncbi:MAG: SixA phosphatase family protein [Burkholderiaceae bacterium]
MDLILWRHADAVPGSETLADLDRPLSPKGARQAKRMGEWLNRVLPENARILVSPAVRTVSTADALDRRYRTVPGLAPDGTIEQLLAEIRWPQARELTVVVGHQPTLGLVAAYLMGATHVTAEHPWRIKKGAIWWIRAKPAEDGSLLVTTVTVRTPELI